MKESEQGRESESRRNFVHKIASRRPAEGISYTKLLPDNPLREFRTQNCFPTTRGGNFVHKIASRQPAEGISYTKLFPDNPLTEFCTRNCFPTTRGGNFAYEIASRRILRFND